MKNYYEILQLKNFATDGEIKKSFRQLAIKYHPDKNKGRKDFEEKFREIANAYEILTDPIKKRDFDFRLSQYDQNKRTTGTTRTNYSEPKQTTNTKSQKEEKKEERSKASIFWIIAIVIFIIYLISSSNSDNETTTGNSKADKELEKKENAKKPRTGEIDFKK